jgi:hypothetical protein
MQPARMVELCLNFARVNERERNGAKPSRCLEGQWWIFLQHCSKISGEMKRRVCLQGSGSERWPRRVKLPLRRLKGLKPALATVSDTFVTDNGSPIGVIGVTGKTNFPGPRVESSLAPA